jgi:CRISPR-associated protein Csx14
MKKLLLATLGESPAVVTEAIDRLQADGIEIGPVVLLTTKDTYTQRAFNLLSEHLPRYYGGKVYLLDVRMLDAFYDVDSEQAAVEFMNHACSALRDYRKVGWEVYASIAGGRKAMSAFLALAAQFYGATMLFHVLVEDPEVEEGGRIRKLCNLSGDKQDQCLHPPVGQIKLVRLPFISLFPLLGEIISGLKGIQVQREVCELLERNGLWRSGSPTELGKVVLQVLESVEALPEPREGGCEVKLAKREPKEADETRKWAEHIVNRFFFVKQVDDIGWREGRPKVKPELPEVLVLFVPGRRVRGIGLRLTTTAKTEGQLYRAAQEVEHWLEKEVGL